MSILLTAFTGFLSRYGLAAVLVGTFLEGETVLLAAGALAEQGLMDPVAVWAVAALGAWLGHLTWFLLARLLASRPALARILHWQPLATRLERVDRVVEGHPDTAIVTLQYLYGVRVLGAFALGLTGLSWRRFLVAEALNCLVWSALFTVTGYAAGDVVTRAFQGWLRWLWIILSAVIVVVLIHGLSRSWGNDRGRG